MDPRDHGWEGEIRDYWTRIAGRDLSEAEVLEIFVNSELLVDILLDLDTQMTSGELAIASPGVDDSMDAPIEEACVRCSTTGRRFNHHDRKDGRVR